MISFLRRAFAADSTPARATSPATKPGLGRTERILVPLDGSETSFDALRTALESSAPGATVYALHVVRELQTDFDYIRQVIAPECREDRAAAMLELELDERGIQGAEVVVRTGGRREQIARAADELSCDLIVVPGKQRSRLARFFDSSPAEAVVREAARPVLVV